MCRELKSTHADATLESGEGWSDFVLDDFVSMVFRSNMAALGTHPHP